MATIQEDARSRSRSPRVREDSVAGTQATASPPEQPASANSPPAPQVPAHWLASSAPPARPDSPGGEATDAPVASTPNKDKGRKGKKGSSKGDSGGGSKESDGAATASSLLAMAVRIEGTDAEATLDSTQLAQLLRRAAARIGSLERVAADLKQTLQAVGALTRRFADGQGGGPQPPDGAALQEEEPRSYLVKKGDEDVQEMYRAQAQARPAHHGGGSSGGALDSSAKTKDEMDQARRARVEKLEALQAEKQKQKEEAEKRSKAHDALFNSAFVGAAKPLGKR